MGVFATLGNALSPTALRSAVKLPRIGKNGPPIAQVIPPQSSYASLVDYGALDADPKDWFLRMQRGDRGDTGPMIDLFDDARDRDSHLDGVIRKRVQSMMGRPLVFRPQEGLENDAEALLIAENARRILLAESRGFRSRLIHLMTGAAYGYAVSPLRWTTNDVGEYVPHLGWAHTNRFAFTRETQEIGYYDGPYRSATKICKLAEYQDCFVVHMPMGGRSDWPWRRGPVRSCIIPSFIKRQGLRFWLTLAERFGMPQPYALVPQGTDKQDESNTDDTVGKVREALKSLSRNWSAVFSKGIEISNIPGAGSVSEGVHKALIDWAEMTESIALLGQNLSTKVEGGSFAAAEAHRFVAGDLHLADAAELGETITQQLVEPLVRYNWPGAPVPVCEISTGQKQTIAVDMVKEGVFSDDEMRRSLGYDAKPNGVGAEYRTPLVQVPGKIEAAPANDEIEVDLELEEPAVIETEPSAPDEAVAKDPSTGLNGAQVDALKQIVLDVAGGVLPKQSAEALILAAFPVSQEQVDKILGPVVVAATTPPATPPPALAA